MITAMINILQRLIGATTLFYLHIMIYFILRIYLFLKLKRLLWATVLQKKINKINLQWLLQRADI